MVQRLFALARSADEDFELLAGLGLADVFIQQLGPQGPLDGFLLRGGRPRRKHTFGRGGDEVVGLDTHEGLIIANGGSRTLMPPVHYCEVQA